MGETDYRRLADALAEEIGTGRLRPGARLEPVRRFAYEHGIAVSTASRVYAELGRRGLVAGEVGRGTYVRAGLAPPPLAEPGRADLVDFEFNFPTVPGQAEALAAVLREALSPERAAEAMRPVGAQGHAAARAAVSRHLARGGWTPAPEHLLFAGGGRQAIGAAIAACVAAGERLGVEAMTYPAVKAMSARLGLVPVPLAMDAEGLLPEAVEAAMRAGPLKAVYVQPVIHNPTGATMGEERRRALAALASREGIALIEDAVFGFLDDSPLPPLIALAPDRVLLVDGMSKRASPGLSSGFVVAPSATLRRRAAAAIRAGAWHASPIGLAAVTAWMDSGLLGTLEARKRQDARARQAVLREGLASHALRGDPRAYHLWLELPEAWRSDAFATAALRRGVAVTASSAFTTQPGHAPNGVRLAFSSPALPAMREGIAILAELLAQGGEAEMPPE
ncbi:PLP-dependent aminotransferase family protein [Roseomonas eburnea]|uniref:PLP-dependent aminotransferase family protein n=1 Tax=Neoroseomonas eburnea TaxID=1346889 RepID=A0A9X9XJN3_9PROT|nr:PLP-dependent aminotransferase family protein [Neoroseomonas eburnea]MBR0683919.1 PLP-dependent aminotransferase family protein [Neoroseomonas eburnea]